MVKTKDWDDIDGANWKYQYKKIGDNGDGITIYDPHSIMNYRCDGQFDVDSKQMTVYSAKSPLKGDKRQDRLSPLDEIGLNLLYPPCQAANYKPKKSIKTRLYYCGRTGATKHHNYPGYDITDGYCGPNNGANCASCRVLKNNDIPLKNSKGNVVWQGSSGYFYCGKYMGKTGSGHDGVCGPSCKSCRRLIV